jgi:VanZ family protein
MRRHSSYPLRQRLVARRGSQNQRSAHAIGRSTRMRIAAITCVGLIVCLSLLPEALEIRTGLPGTFEHFVAYLGTGAVLASLIPDRSGVILFALIATATVLEAFQGLVPGREPTVLDAFVGGLGAASGVGLARLYGSLRRKDTASGLETGPAP